MFAVIRKHSDSNQNLCRLWKKKKHLSCAVLLVSAVNTNTVYACVIKTTSFLCACACAKEGTISGKCCFYCKHLFFLSFCNRQSCQTAHQRIIFPFYNVFICIWLNSRMWKTFAHVILSSRLYYCAFALLCF